MTRERKAAPRPNPADCAPIIGEYCSGPGHFGERGLTRALPAYWLYETAHAALSPARALAGAGQFLFQHPANPFAATFSGKLVAATCELVERATRHYGKPEWDITSTVIDGQTVPVGITPLWERPFCRLIHFERLLDDPVRPQPRLLIVAPMSGHFPTLIRGTIQAFLPSHDVFVTEWVDARLVPIIAGHFDLDDYIDYLIEMLHVLKGDVHLMAVCQASVPVLAAVALMEAAGDPAVPRSMILMGGPIDTRINPTSVNRLAEQRGLEWFRRNVITKVPFPNPGFLRDVYPGFLQLYGFMVMNLDRHMQAHQRLFQHLVAGDHDSAQRHREFYDEYLAVMDLSAEFYLQTCDTVFIRHALPRGEMTHRGHPVDPSRIRRVALMTVEGEHDDISGVGQTEAAHELCPNIPAPRRSHWLQPGVGHYGVFNGERFRTEVVPKVTEFILACSM
ncbi:polyhydroxyalkanoate depolymerase [Paraburkholderia sp. J8-2]|uniref:polyhydroxyalkanoate depolymerase n=1 Tax=Paraburkholderia sp. J8-2 TaxID=2805440 RepID=UPI002AB68C6E|nr:polyhydroxyalkanoate depolymerase [Paraburkholderia sp. J8-2]